MNTFPSGVEQMNLKSINRFLMSRTVTSALTSSPIYKGFVKLIVISTIIAES